ncbi:hypothetical protein ACTNEO_05235 [Gracilibacillus sp. HCP3S3_G5_1]|uniref:hypothetical protein n=1 Tax=unclassified Gracilibacillus TaxID=2625209 RepID=UPI003F8B686A
MSGKKDLIKEQTKEDMLKWVNEAIQHADNEKELVELLVLKSDILESFVTGKRLTI